MIMAFLSSLSTVSDGCAPTESHFLIAGAFKLVSFRSGSYQPSSCTHGTSVTAKAATVHSALTSIQKHKP